MCPHRQLFDVGAEDACSARDLWQKLQLDGRAFLSGDKGPQHDTRWENAFRLRGCHACRTTKKSKGIALVQFAEPAGALAAKEALDGAIFQGRLLHVLPAHRPPPPKQAPEQV